MANQLHLTLGTRETLSQILLVVHVPWPTKVQLKCISSLQYLANYQTVERPAQQPVKSLLPVVGLLQKPVILLPAHPASFAHKFLFQRVPASPGMQKYCRLVIKNSVLDS